MTTATNTARTITCKHCKAFNGRSRCGCAVARAERGEAVAAAASVDAIELPGFDAAGRFVGSTEEF